MEAMKEHSQDDSFVIERVFNASPERIWKAISNKDEMKNWYFDLKEFKAEIGFKFQFEAGSDAQKYLHKCEVTQVIPGKKLAYSWSYDGYPGMSEVVFEIFPEGDKTRLKLTHTGLSSFPSDNSDFGRSSFAAGWTHIIGTSLKDYVEK